MDYAKLIENAKTLTRRPGEHIYIVYAGGPQTIGWVNPIRPNASQELEKAGPNIRVLGSITFQNDEHDRTTTYQIHPLDFNEAELSRALATFLKERNAEIVLEVKVRIPTK